MVDELPKSLRPVLALLHPRLSGHHFGVPLEDGGGGANLHSQEEMTLHPVFSWRPIAGWSVFIERMDGTVERDGIDALLGAVLDLVPKISYIERAAARAELTSPCLHQHTILLAQSSVIAHHSRPRLFIVGIMELETKNLRKTQKCE